MNYYSLKSDLTYFIASNMNHNYKNINQDVSRLTVNRFAADSSTDDFGMSVYN